MNESMGNAIITTVSKLEGVIRELAPTVWRVYVKQAYIEAIGCILFAGLLLGVAKWLVNNKKRLVEKEDGSYDKENISIGHSFGIVLCVVIAVLLLVFNVGTLFNVEYHAIRAITYSFK